MQVLTQIGEGSVGVTSNEIFNLLQSRRSVFRRKNKWLNLSTCISFQQAILHLLQT